jgi:glycosyl transferase/beta-hydroxylase protein BlmF
VAAFRNARLQDVATATLRDESGRQAWVVAAVNGSLLARRALTRLISLEPRTARSRLRFRLRARGDRRPSAPRLRLSLLCPTRGRVRLVATFLGSLHRTAAEPARVETLFYVDSDDPDLPHYRELLDSVPSRYPGLGPSRLVVGDPVGVPAAWNTLAEAAEGDLLLMANDDQLYVDFGWDVHLDRRMAEIGARHPDEVCCLYFDAGQYADGGCDFPMVSRRWYDTLGYFTPTIFQQWEVERWVFDLARRVDRLYCVPGVLVEHRHYQDYKAPFDKTYQRHRMTRAKSFSDHALFLQTEAARARDAAALREAIDRFSHPAQPIAAATDHWFVPYLEQCCPRIRVEVDAALELTGGPLREHERVDLIRAGQWNEEMRARFPVTATSVAVIPEATTLGPGQVSIVRLAGRAAMMTGDAPMTGALRGYLGIRVPDGAALTIGDQALPLTDGRCIITSPNPGGLAASGPVTDVMVLVFDVCPPP